MTEEELMKALKQAARDRLENEVSDKWDALAAGALTDEEIAELAANDPEGVLGEMFAPLGDEFVDAVLDDVLGEHTAEIPSVVPDERDESEEAPPAAVPAELAEPPAPANTQRWWLAVLPLAAVAAVLIAVLAWPGSARLPDYAFEVQGGDRVVRGGSEPEAGVRELAPGSRLTLVARPPTAVDGVEASLVVRDAAGLRIAVSHLEVSASGAVRWVGTSGREPLVPGVTGVALVVHRSGAYDSEVVGLVGTDAAHAHEVPVKVIP